MIFIQISISQKGIQSKPFCHIKLPILLEYINSITQTYYHQHCLTIFYVLVCHDLVHLGGDSTIISIKSSACSKLHCPKNANFQWHDEYWDVMVISFIIYIWYVSLYISFKAKITFSQIITCVWVIEGYSANIKIKIIKAKSCFGKFFEMHIRVLEYVWSRFF